MHLHDSCQQTAVVCLFMLGFNQGAQPWRFSAMMREPFII
jgi:hypothetical protein